MGIVSYAQNFEDVMLWRALGHIERGTYLDVGAHDPVIDSVSKGFYERGWRGVHVEPTAFYADLLRKDRPEELVIQGALAAESGLLTFFEVPSTGLSTASAEVAEHHRKRGYELQETTVTALTLDDAFKHVGSEVNWLKIDVEGFEREVLAGWRRSECRPWIIVVESTFPNSKLETHGKWEVLILGKGYSFVYCDGLNRFYTSDAHPDLRDAFRFGPNVFDEFQISETSRSIEAVNRRFGASLEIVTQQKALVEEQLTESRAAFERAASEWEARERSLRDQASRALELVKDEAQSYAREVEKRFFALAEQFAQIQHDAQELTAEATKLHTERESVLRADLAKRDREISERLEQVRREIHTRRQVETQQAEREQRLRSELSTITAASMRSAQLFAEREKALTKAFNRTASSLKIEAAQRVREHTERERLLRAEIARCQREGQEVLAAQKAAFVAQAQILRRELLGTRDSLVRLTAEAAACERRLRESAKRDVEAVRSEKYTRLQELMARHCLEMKRMEGVNEGLRLQLAERDRELKETLANREELERRLSEESHERLRATKRVEAMRRAFSWRITAPLRLFSKSSATDREAAGHGSDSNPPLSQEFPGIPKLHDVNAPAPSGLLSENSTDRPSMSVVNSRNNVPLKEDPTVGNWRVGQLLARNGAAFIEVVYQTILGRPPDQDGFKYYMGRLRAGEAKREIIAQIARSSEASQRHVELSGLPELLIEQSVRRHWLWGRIFRMKYVEQQLSRLEDLVDSIADVSASRQEELIHAVREIKEAQTSIQGTVEQSLSKPRTPVLEQPGEGESEEVVAPELGERALYVLALGGQTTGSIPSREGV